MKNIAIKSMTVHPLPKAGPPARAIGKDPDPAKLAELSAFIDDNFATMSAVRRQQFKTHAERTVRGMLGQAGTLIQDVSDREPERQIHEPGYAARAERLKFALDTLHSDDVEFLSRFLHDPPGFTDLAQIEKTERIIEGLRAGCDKLASHKQQRGAVASTDWPMLAALALWDKYARRPAGVANTSPFTTFANAFFKALRLPTGDDLRRRITEARAYRADASRPQFALPRVYRNP